MSLEKARAYLKEHGFEDRILTFTASSATVEEAALAVGCEPARIAKTLSFEGEAAPILIVAAGDTRIDNRKFKDFFHHKARMLKPEVVEEQVGYAPGGVCPFGVNQGVRIFLDEALKRFDSIYPACGDAHSAVKLSVDELLGLTHAEGFIDIAKQ